MDIRMMCRHLLAFVVIGTYLTLLNARVRGMVLMFGYSLMMLFLPTRHEGYKEGIDPAFSTPWDSFVLMLPKFNVVGVEGVYVSDVNDAEDNNERGGQKGGQKNEEKTIDTILQLIKDNPNITRKVLVQAVGISSSAIQKHINRLKAEGVIIRHGGDRGGYWETID